MMTTLRSFLCGTAVLAATWLPQVTPAAAADVARTTVNVTVEYTGSGEVNASHRLWIWLFDTPDFGSGAAIPVAEQSLAENGGIAVFEAVRAGQVWIAVAYDERGGFTGSAPPPSGAPVSAYVRDGVPAPVTPGEDANVRIVFDDSTRMP